MQFVLHLNVKRSFVSIQFQNTIWKQTKFDTKLNWIDRVVQYSVLLYIGMYCIDTSTGTGGRATVTMFVQTDGYCGVAINGNKATVLSMMVLSCPSHLCCNDHLCRRWNRNAASCYFCIGMSVCWSTGEKSMMILVGEHLDSDACYLAFKYFTACKRRTKRWSINGIQSVYAISN